MAYIEIYTRNMRNIHIVPFKSATNVASRWELKIIAKSFEFDLMTKYARQPKHTRAHTHIYVHNAYDAQTYRITCGSNAHYQFRMAESVHAKSTSTHQRDTRRERVCVIDIRTSRRIVALA